MAKLNTLQLGDKIYDSFPDKEARQAIENLGAGSAAIIDVIELPDEDINENVFYRLLKGTFVYNQFVRNDATCYCVNNLPDEGYPALSGDLSVIENATITAYYNVANDNVYGYVTPELATIFEVPSGWYLCETLMAAVGFTFSGIITDINDDPRDDTFSLLLEYIMYSYKDEWISHQSIGMTGTGSSAERFNHPSNIASGVASHAEGFQTVANGKYSHAGGWNTLAQGNYAHAEGWLSHAEGHGSHAEGVNTYATSNASHTEGRETSASGECSHAEGYLSQANGRSAHAEGEETAASGAQSHAEGYLTTASGGASHAENSNTIASGAASHAEGYYTRALGAFQHVQGKYNILDTKDKYAHIVGNGTSNSKRSNVHTLDWDGSAWFKGNIYVGGTGQDDQVAQNLNQIITNLQSQLANLITTDDIDAICGTTMNMATLENEVTF